MAGATPFGCSQSGRAIACWNKATASRSARSLGVTLLRASWSIATALAGSSTWSRIAPATRLRCWCGRR